MIGHRTLHLIAATALAATTMTPTIADARERVSLDRVIAFENPSDPWLSEGSDRIFSQVWSPVATGVTVPGIGFTKISTRNDAASGWTSNHVALSGDWHGLAMTGFSLNGVPNSGVGAYVLHFADSPARVVAELDRLGYPIHGVGRDVRTGGSDCGAKLRVDSEGEGLKQGARFTISFAC